MDIEKQKSVIENYFKSHSTRDIMKSFYKDDLKDYEAFDRKLWEEIIDKQLELNDEHLAYFAEEEGMTRFSHIFSTFHSTLEKELPWTVCENCTFPTMFHLFEHNGKQIIVTLMVGQGCTMDTCTVKGFKKWMVRNKTTFTMPAPVTLDEFETAVKKTLERLNRDIANANDTNKEKNRN